LAAGIHPGRALEEGALLDHQRRGLEIAADLGGAVDLDAGLRLDVPVHLAVDHDGAQVMFRVDARGLAHHQDVVGDDRADEARIDADGCPRRSACLRIALRCEQQVSGRPGDRRSFVSLRRRFPVLWLRLQGHARCLLG